MSRVVPALVLAAPTLGVGQAGAQAIAVYDGMASCRVPSPLMPSHQAQFINSATAGSLTIGGSYQISAATIPARECCVIRG